MDCADLALTTLAAAAAEYGLPLSVPVWDGNTKSMKALSSQDNKYNNLEDYQKDLRQNLGAINLIDRDKVTKSKDLPKLEAGDLIIYDLRSHRDSRYSGHTRIVLSNDTGKEEMTIGEAHLPPTPSNTSTMSYKELKDGNWPGTMVKDKGREWNWSEIGK